MATTFNYLTCTECGARNYRRRQGEKPRRPEDRLETRKFCKQCGKHVLHRQTG